MTEPLPGYRTSSARRPRSGPALIAAAALVAMLLAIALALRSRDGGLDETAAAAPTAVPTATRVPTATSTATPVVLESGWQWAGAADATPTATPWPTLPPLPTRAARRGPSPTPRPAECVTFRWTSRQVFTPSAQVLVEIDAVNRCGRDLGPLELWFEISGWRGGGLVQSVRGHPFDRIRPGGSEIVAIGLPGSIDWYDEMTVAIVD